MGFKYTRYEDFSARLPKGIPSEFKQRCLDADPTATDGELLVLWLAEIDTVIETKSEYIDACVGTSYLLYADDHKFPQYGDAPDCPKIIQEICKNLCLSELLGYYKGTMQGRTDDTMAHYKNLADDKLAEIRSLKIVVSVAGIGLVNMIDPSGPETKSDVLITGELGSY